MIKGMELTLFLSAKNKMSHILWFENVVAKKVTLLYSYCIKECITSSYSGSAL
jgi:hypothetical protein